MPQKDWFSDVVAQLTGGSHGSGKVGYADYLESMHAHMLFGDQAAAYSSVGTQSTNNAYAIVNTILAATGINPFITSGTVASGNAVFRSAYDSPSQIESAITIGFTPLNNLVTALNPTSDWVTYMQTVKTNLDSIVYSAGDLNNAVDSYEAQATPTFMRSLSRFTAGMADINAVCGGAFVIGMVNLERQFVQDINDYRGKLNLQWKKERNLSLMQGISDIAGLVMKQLAAKEAAGKFYFDLMRARSAAGVEKSNADIDYQMRGIDWKVERLQTMTSILSSIAGTSTVPRPISPIAAFASGFLSTGASLAMMGAQVGGPQGALLGFALGGILGGIGGVLANS